MADLTPEQQQEQYAAIELLYSEGKWNEVLQASEALLAVLPPLQGQVLRPRLELVIGHALLYGLNDLHGAEGRYRTVLLETEEPVLREIAEQGLARCGGQRQGVVETSGPDSTAAAITPAEAPASEAVAEAAAGFAGDAARSVLGEPAGVAGPESSAQAPDPASTVAAMPWELGAPAPSGAGGAGGSATGAAMPWLTELGMAPPAAAGQPDEDTPGLNTPFAGAAQTMEEAIPTEAQHLGAEALTQQSSPAEVASPGERPFASEEPVPAEKPAPGEEPSPPPEPTAAEETLARLREPEALIPVTVQVLEEPAPPVTQQEPEPEPDPAPLSPEEMAELARGLLEVVLR